MPSSHVNSFGKVLTDRLRHHTQCRAELIVSAATLHLSHLASQRWGAGAPAATAQSATRASSSWVLLSATSKTFGGYLQNTRASSIRDEPTANKWGWERRLLRMLYQACTYVRGSIDLVEAGNGLQIT